MTRRRQTKRFQPSARKWYPEITALVPGDECEFRYPARPGWMPATVVHNGGSGFWQVRLESGKIESGYSEQIKAKGGSHYEDEGG